MVWGPSARVSSVVVMSKVWPVTPGPNVSVPLAGEKSAALPVADQPTVTSPTRLAPLRVTVTRAVPPSTTLAVAVANWMVPADCRSPIVTVAWLGAAMDAPVALTRLTKKLRLPRSTPSSRVAMVNVPLLAVLAIVSAVTAGGV